MQSLHQESVGYFPEGGGKKLAPAPAEGTARVAHEIDTKNPGCLTFDLVGF